MDSDDSGCPRCKTTKYRNPSLKLLVNVCGHPLCQSCMEMLFVKGSGPCPECGIILRRGTFRVQLFEDPFVEREVDIRKRILKDYCKTEEDFATLREYNDYLEEIEDIVFNLAKDVNIVETNKKIDQYKKENADQIKRARILGNPYIHELDEILHQEKILAEKRNFEKTVLEKEELMRRQKTKDSLIDSLMFSDTDANAILTAHKLQIEQEEVKTQAAIEAKRAEFLASVTTATKTTPATAATTKVNKPGFFSSGLSIGSASSKAAPALPAKEELYVYEDVNYHDPSIPTLEDIISKKYVSNFRATTEEEIAGGFHVSKSVHHGLLDILSQGNILFDPETDGVNLSDEDEDSDADHSRMDTD